jgi:hypothetical protein
MNANLVQAGQNSAGAMLPTGLSASFVACQKMSVRMCWWTSTVKNMVMFLGHVAVLISSTARPPIMLFHGICCPQSGRGGGLTPLCYTYQLNDVAGQLASPVTHHSLTRHW